MELGLRTGTSVVCMWRVGRSLLPWSVQSKCPWTKVPKNGGKDVCYICVYPTPQCREAVVDTSNRTAVFTPSSHWFAIRRRPLFHLPALVLAQLHALFLFHLVHRTFVLLVNRHLLMLVALAHT